MVGIAQFVDASKPRRDTVAQQGGWVNSVDVMSWDHPPALPGSAIMIPMIASIVTQSTFDAQQTAVSYGATTVPLLGGVISDPENINGYQGAIWVFGRAGIGVNATQTVTVTSSHSYDQMQGTSVSYSGVNRLGEPMSVGSIPPAPFVLSAPTPGVPLVFMVMGAGGANILGATNPLDGFNHPIIHDQFNLATSQQVCVVSEAPGAPDLNLTCLISMGQVFSWAAIAIPLL